MNASLLEYFRDEKYTFFSCKPWFERKRRKRKKKKQIDYDA